MNWGYRLMFLFIGFAALIGTLVYKATHTKFELVSKDYYGDELRYQEKIDGMNNASAAGHIQIQKTGRTVQLTLPASLKDKADSAEVWLYCEANASHDRKFGLAFVSGEAQVDVAKIPSDKYELRVQFAVAKKQYYYIYPLNLR